MEKGEMGENATGRLATYYVAECMEFNRYGEYREDIHSAEEAVKIYQSIPSERLNAGKGIGLHVEEEDGIPLEFSLVYNGELDVDLLRDIYDQNQYPEVFIAARELSAYLPETKVIDTKGLLTKKSMDAADFADEMIKLEKNLDPDFYHTFYPKEAEHKEAIIWKALCQDGKEEYIRWLGSKIFEQKPELKEQADKLKTTLEQVKLIPPVDLKPFVYVRISEHPDIPLEEAMPLNQAVELFGKLDRQSVETVYYVREQFQKAEQAGIPCSINKPYYKGQRISMWSLIPMKMIPPTRTVRYCCEILKESGGTGRFILTGVRWAESRKRRNSRGIYENFVPNGKARAVILNNDNDDTRRLFEACFSRSKHVCNPIIDWSDQDVWEYIRSEKIPMNPLYEMGFYRVGCIGCPMAGKQRYREFQIFPTYERAYRHAFAKMLDLRKKAGRQCDSRIWGNVDAFFRWWM